jgi:hypothetical protein
MADSPGNWRFEDQQVEGNSVEHGKRNGEFLGVVCLPIAVMTGRSARLLLRHWVLSQRIVCLGALFAV